MPGSRSTCACTSARPASRPSASPCSKASLCASSCRSARPATVAIFGAAPGLPISGAVHSCGPPGTALMLESDKFASALAAQTDGAFLGQTLRDDHDLLLRRLDIGELHRPARFHVVLE